ncbi:ROK family protein [Sphingomonas sp. M1-B02]|uniref:ROK family protein n=1 Tax=Sphingomonas sp. M1-B02 TaxID=3114300 RepID=UPI002240A5FD|nr:ROK family protein [Sphingomonas sp. S6-11]UZK67698.1 ROK family protein [Sphingomonas sp. S6-11]
MTNALQSPEPGRDASGGRPWAGVELGGTKCVCTLAFGPERVIDQRTVATTSPDDTLPALLEVLHGWKQAHDFAALGIASFGPIDIDRSSPTHGQILATNKPRWPGTDVLRALSGPFEMPVGFDTDVNGAALAEIAWGCGKGVDDFAYVTVGTGVGVGLIVLGRPTRGFAHGEWGHIRVPRLLGDDHPSVCSYHDDCVEGLASGTALVSRLAGRTVREISEDDPAWDAIVHYIAAMAHALVCGAAPRRIAIGGGVLSAQPHLLARIDRALRVSINGYLKLPDDYDYVTRPGLGDLAGPLGSIALAVAAAEEACRAG